MSRLDKLVAGVVSAIKKKYPNLEIIEIYALGELTKEVRDFAVDLTVISSDI
ncbi:MAG: hypothetical protein ACE5KT_04925 [Methanosarcinales archaeon]